MHELYNRPCLVGLEEGRPKGESSGVVLRYSWIETADGCILLRFVEDGEVLSVTSHSDVRFAAGEVGEIVEQIITERIRRREVASVVLS